MIRSDGRYPAVFFAPGHKKYCGPRVECGAFTGQDTITIRVMPADKGPGSYWYECQLLPDDAEQLALHILERVVVRKSKP